MSPVGAGQCRWCGAAVLWLQFAGHGRLAPIDAEPSVGGNIRVDQAAGRYEVIGSRAAREAIELISGPVLHVNHWMTCPAANARRLARRKPGLVSR